MDSMRVQLHKISIFYLIEKLLSQSLKESHKFRKFYENPTHYVVSRGRQIPRDFSTSLKIPLKNTTYVGFLKRQKYHALPKYHRGIRSILVLLKFSEDPRVFTLDQTCKSENCKLYFAKRLINRDKKHARKIFSAFFEEKGDFWTKRK